MSQLYNQQQNNEFVDYIVSTILNLQPLTPTEAKPDMASLRLVKESELRRGNIIGSGAFGTVYKVIHLHISLE